MFVVETRYQYWTRLGIEWTKWFSGFSTGKFESESYAKEYIKTLPKKVNKLKYEYRITAIP